MTNSNTALANEFTNAALSHEQCLRAMATGTVASDEEKQGNLDAASDRLVAAMKAVMQTQ